VEKPSSDVSALVMVNPRRNQEWRAHRHLYLGQKYNLQALQTAKSLMELTSRLAAESAWPEAAYALLA